ncbi:hypothetical protein [Asaia platycodi]|uniref:hypothetical protein n=1 Tax=Asaia platycodi TaxID=610243 RepID=UPI0004718E84|nr:hypothetical protein [Asaia platycodi]
MARADGFPLVGGALHSRRERMPRVTRQEEAPRAQPDLFDYVPPVRRTHLMPEEAPLLIVTTRAFSEKEREDGWLYSLLPAARALSVMDEGLTLDAREPLMFCERPALLPLFTAADEETAETETTLLRVRRTHIAPWLEDDPDMSARLGAACYLLSRQTPIG